MPLSSEQLRQYNEEGYTVARGLISPQEAEAVRKRLMEILDDCSDWPPRHLQIANPEKYRNAKGGHLVWGLQGPASREQVFLTVADHPNLKVAMEQILGGGVVRHTDQALIKHKAFGGESFYHQDSYYWKLNPRQGCNCWIALDEVGKGAIALAIMPGSHASWELTAHEDYYDDPSFHNAVTLKAFLRHRIPASAVDFSREALLPMKPGDGAFFSNYTWHRAEPNRSGEHKSAYAIAYKLKPQDA